MVDGTVRAFEKAVADAHPNGVRPWGWPDYVGKLDDLTGSTVEAAERERFLGLAGRVGDLLPEEVRALNPSLPAGKPTGTPSGRGLFDWSSGPTREARTGRAMPDR